MRAGTYDLLEKLFVGGGDRRILLAVELGHVLLHLLHDDDHPKLVAFNRVPEPEQLLWLIIREASGKAQREEREGEYRLGLW